MRAVLQLNLEVEPREQVQYTQAAEHMCLRCCFHVKLAKRPGDLRGFYRGIKHTDEMVLRNALMRATWLVVLKTH